jgi:hypothetical protein
VQTESAKTELDKRMNSDGFTLVTRTSKKTGVVAEPGDGIIFESDNMRRKKKRGTLLKSDFYTFQRQVNKFDSEYRYVPVTLISLHFMEVLSMQSCQNCEPSSRMIKTGLPRSRRRESSNPIEESGACARCIADLTTGSSRLLAAQLLPTELEWVQFCLAL